jgi:membrane protein implicated in regulation of membrane protease activity
LFRCRTREERIRKMRVLEAVSAGLSLTAAAIIVSILTGGGDVQLLFLAAFCCLLVAAYQLVNFYLGYKLQERVGRSRADGTGEIEAGVGERSRALNPADTTPFVGGRSVTESTTELLEPIPREAKRDR